MTTQQIAQQQESPRLVELRGPASGRLYGYFDLTTGELVVKDRGHGKQIERIDLRRLMEVPDGRA